MKLATIDNSMLRKKRKKKWTKSFFFHNLNQQNRIPISNTA